MIPMGRDSVQLTIWASSTTDTYGDVVESWTKGNDVRVTLYKETTMDVQTEQGQDDRSVFRCFIAGNPALTVHDRLGTGSNPQYEITDITAHNGTTMLTLRSI